MNTILALLSILLTGESLVDAQTLRAGERGEGHHIDTSWDSTVFEKSHTAIFSLRALLDSVDKQLAGHSLLRIHQFTEPIKTSVKELDLDSSLSGMERKKVHGYLHNIARFTDGMRDASNRKQLDETLQWHKQLNSEARLLEKFFEEVYAPPIPDKPMNEGMHHRVGRGKPVSAAMTFSVPV